MHVLRITAAMVSAVSSDLSREGIGPHKCHDLGKTTMNTITVMLPYVVLALGLAIYMKALVLLADRTTRPAKKVRRGWDPALIAILAWPAAAQAQVVNLRTATESGNAIIMYLSATFAAVGIVAAGVAMMMGRQSIAKWAFAGAMVSGLAFAIVRAMWTNMGLEASDVSTF